MLSANCSVNLIKANHTFITLINAQTGVVLADNIEVKGGKWKVKVHALADANAPEFIQAINTDGCFTDKEVKMENRPEEDEGDDDDDDDNDDDDDDHDKHEHEDS